MVMVLQQKFNKRIYYENTPKLSYMITSMRTNYIIILSYFFQKMMISEDYLGRGNLLNYICCVPISIWRPKIEYLKFRAKVCIFKADSLSSKFISCKILNVQDGRIV